MNFQKPFAHMTDAELIAIINNAPVMPTGYNDVMPRSFDHTAHENARRARDILGKRATEAHTPATRKR